MNNVDSPATIVPLWDIKYTRPGVSFLDTYMDIFSCPKTLQESTMGIVPIWGSEKNNHNFLN